MAETKGFSHITVTSDDDDDVIIQAGIVEEAPADDGETVFEAAGEDEEARAVEAVEGDEVVAIEPAPEPAVAPEPKAPATSAKPAKGDGYRETTLEDIQSSKMSSAQKVVIVVAIVGILAFVAWYVLAH